MWVARIPIGATVSLAVVAPALQQVHAIGPDHCAQHLVANIKESNISTLPISCSTRAGSCQKLT